MDAESLAAMAEAASKSAPAEPTEDEISLLQGFAQTTPHHAPTVLDENENSDVLDSVEEEEEDDQSDQDFVELNEDDQNELNRGPKAHVKAEESKSVPVAPTTPKSAASKKAGTDASAKKAAGTSLPPTPTIGASPAAKTPLGKGRGKYVDAASFEAIYEEFKREHYNTSVLRSYTPRSAEVYGEALPVFVEFLIKKLNIKSSDTFYDIGSGIGNVVVQVAARTGCKAIGVEVRQDLDEIANNLKVHTQKRLQEIGKPCGEIILETADATAEDGKAIQFIAESTIIFMNNVCYPAAMQQKLEQLFESSSSHGTKIIAMKHLFPRGDVTTKRMKKGIMALFKQPWTKITTPKDMFSWTSNCLTFYVYEVDRSSLTYFSEEPDDAGWKRRKKVVAKKATPKAAAAGANDSTDLPIVGKIKKKKKGPPEGERRFRKPKKSTPREPLPETHLLVSSYIVPGKDGNEVLDKYTKLEPEGRFYADDRSHEEKFLDEGRNAKIKLPAYGRFKMERHVFEANSTLNALSMKHFLSSDSRSPDMLPKDPKERIMACWSPTSILLANKPTAPPLPDVHPYVPWAVPPRELPPTRVISIEMRNTGLNLNTSGDVIKEESVEKEPTSADAMQVDSIALPAGPCTFEKKDWGLPCLNHTSFDSVSGHLKEMFDAPDGYYARCLHFWTQTEEGRYRSEILEKIRPSAIAAIGSPNTSIRHLLASLFTRVPEDVLLDILKEISPETWLKQFGQNNSVVLRAILARFESATGSHNFALHRAVLVSSLSGVFVDVLNIPQALSNIKIFWSLLASRSERQPLLDQIVGNILTIMRHENGRSALCELKVLDTEDREEIEQILHAIVSEAPTLIENSDACLKGVWNLLMATSQKKLVSEIALTQLRPFLRSWFTTTRVGLVIWLLEEAQSETAAALVANAFLSSSNQKEILNYADNTRVIIRYVLPSLKADLKNQLKSVLATLGPTLDAQARFYWTEYHQSGTPKGAAAKKKRPREEAEAVAGSTELSAEDDNPAKKPKLDDAAPTPSGDKMVE